MTASNWFSGEPNNANDEDYAALGATYDIQFSTDSVDWTVIEADIVGEGNAVERLYSKKDFPTGFFRVERTDQ